MRRFIFNLLLLTVLLGHAADETFVVDGVVYERNNLTCLAVGWDRVTPIQSLHILGEVMGLWQVEGIQAGAFQDITSIEYVKIDEGVTYIGQNAFNRCTGLKSVVLPEGLDGIEEEAFSFCTGLMTMVIPSTVTDIQAHAFSGCTGVTDVYFLMQTIPDNFGWWDGVYPSQGEDEHGGKEFGTVTATKIHVPDGCLQAYIDSHKFDAWLKAMQPDDGSYPLWWIVNYGVVGREYTVSDPLTAVYVDKNGDLYAKDDNHWLLPDKVYSGEFDYLGGSGLASAPQYDQSNWVILHDAGLSSGCYLIEGGTITGKLVDKRNPVIDVTSELTKGENATYVPNVYIAASLMGRTQLGSNGRTYAFVRPKPQEFARYEWSIYGEDGNFYVPANNPDLGMNMANLAGGFHPNYNLLQEGHEDELLENACYPMTAITRHQQPVEDKKSVRQEYNPDDSDFRPNVEGGVTTQYEVFPLALATGPDVDPIITGITRTEMQESSSNNIYYDLCGRNLGTAKPTTPGIYIHRHRTIVVK